ncbi:MAG: RNA 2',3'-cyclic phosphodiesterase [Pseudorhodobacter sp.]|nr:RNA 2',3'-cyclic phosphodiesterase [Pseudorhodobacter sp.]
MRLFLALDLPDAVRSSLAVQQFLLPIPDPVPPERFHITLCFLGEVTDLQAEALHERLEPLRFAPFSVELQGFGLFGKEKPRSVWAAVAPSPALIHLQGKLAQAARLSGLRLEARKFVPHVTLARFSALQMPDAPRLERAVIAPAGYRSGPIEVRGFHLYDSVLYAKEPHYDILASYPARG